MSIVSLPLPVQMANGQVADGGQVMTDLNYIASAVNANAAGSGVNSDITQLTNLSTISSNVTFSGGVTLTNPAINGATIDGTTTGVTQPVGTNTNQLATMAALIQQAFSTALPAQSLGLLTSNGSTAGFTKSLSFGLNQSKDTVASATTPDIWSALGNVINYTGTATCTGFPAAPQAGSSRLLICSGAAVFTASANMLINGVNSGSSYTASANDQIYVYALTTTQFLLMPVKYNGQPISQLPALAGSSQSAPYTFTSASGSVIVTPTAFGQYVTLDSGLNFTNTGLMGSIKNGSSVIPLGVKDNTGTVLGWIAPSTKTPVDLVSNASQAGTWSLNLLKQAVTAATFNQSIASGSMSLQRITVDANRTALIFGNGGSSAYAQVYDASSQTFGAPTLVRSGIASSTAFLSILSATNQVLVVSNDSTTGMQAVTLTLSGTAVTVNTAATATLAGNFTAYSQLIAVGTGFVIGYSRSTTTVATRVMTISGTTVTIGAENAINTSNSYAPVLYAVDSSHFTAAYETGTSLVVTPVVISAGTTQTSGTAATITETASGLKTIALGSGRWLYCYLNTTTFASIVSVNTTTNTATASSATVGTAFLNQTFIDLVAVSATKIAAVYVPSGASSAKANVITDNSGTISNGSEITVNLTTTGAIIGAIGASGNSAYFAVGASPAYGVVALDCSGSSPVLSSFNYLSTASISNGAPETNIGSDTYCNRNGRFAISGTVAYTVDSNNPAPNVRFDPNGVQIYTGLALPDAGATNRKTVSAGYQAGAVSTESWFLCQTNSSTGYTLYKVESAV